MTKAYSPPSKVVKANPRRGRGEPRLSDVECRRYEKQIIRLREQKRSYKEIARTLKMSVGTVREWVLRLAREGLVAQPKRGRQENLAPFNRESERVQIVIDMMKRRATRQEIGLTLGVCRERARQVVNEISAECGSGVFVPPEQLWFIPEAATKLGTSRNVVYRLCRRGVVPYQRRGNGKSGCYVITQTNLDALRKYLRERKQSVCVVCKRTFWNNGYTGKLTCSNKKCCAQHDLEVREKLLTRAPSADSLGRWIRELWLTLKSRTLPRNERWLTLSAACRVSGLSMTQVNWLGHRHVVATCGHPTKRWCKLPLTMYAVSEMKIARKVYAAYQQRLRS